MYLKTIEIQGFKSFANKTVFEFHNGVTGIVGPNGSGKSNVADAVRWVLGEQRAKQLRGGSMQDVIFAGTESRKPLGYASVAITLDNTDHALPVSYDEVTVTRRLYRSGESEYKLNGTTCRLKDIQEIFYDTGIGKEGYSIIGQGQIDKILGGKPDERRELFDEAVGIVKFKRRKMQAVRKLQDEQANLIRVNDILSELSRQVGPLRRQSEKAAIYLEKKEQLKSYEVNSFLEEYLSMKTRLEEVSRARDAAAKSMEETRQAVEALREKYDSVGNELGELENERVQCQERLTALQIEKEKNEGQIALLQEKIRVLKEGEEARKERIVVCEEQILEKEGTIDTLQETIEALHAHIEEQKREQAEKRSRQEEASGHVDALTQQLEKIHQQELSLMGMRAGVEASMQGNETLREQLSIRKSEITNRILRLRTDESDATGTLERLTNENAAIEREIALLQKQSEDAGKKLTVVQESVAAYTQQLEHKNQEYHRARSRLETLRGIAERYDGYGNSIRRVMEQRAQNPGIRGVVADLIKTKKDYETAIETALGGSIQHIVTDNEDTAKKMIAYLKNGRYGRATFLPLSAMRYAGGFNQENALREPGVIGLASELVTAGEQYKGLVRQLLGRTIVTDNIDSAIALNKKYRYSLRIVTLEGDLLSPGGSMSGGSFKNNANLLGRRREIADLEKQLKLAGESRDALQEKIQQEKDRRNELRDTIRGLSEQLQRKYLEQNTTRMEQREVEKRSGQTGEAFKSLQTELMEINGKISQAEDERQAALQEEEDLNAQQETLEEQQKSAADAQQQWRNELTGLQSELEELTLQITTDEQKEVYLKAEKQRYHEEAQQLKVETEALRSGKDDGQQEDGLREQIGQLQTRITQDAEQAEKEEEQLSQIMDAESQKKQQQKAYLDQREQMTQKAAALEREHYRLESQAEKIESDRERRISYMWDEYELTYGKALELKRDDLGDKDTWKEQTTLLRRQIRDLGHVNVDAIEEYKEISERHTFLMTQHEDLTKAEAALQKIITELDNGMRTQFKENFAKIQVEFDKAFKELFGGGKGTLELADGEDILEAGIHIIAQPPGKKLQNMMQLSGGEKALSAIALLFAIQNLKPSPFCLLDEIEAALDESNVERYAGYLHKLTKHTQFIIITHRRGTMAAADRLYGVTMQEKGISALVSVNLIEGQLDG